MEGEALGPVKVLCPSIGECQGQEAGSGWVEEQGEGREDREFSEGKLGKGIAYKIFKGGNMETKDGAETEGKTIQRQPTLGSIPRTVTKPRHYCGCQQVLADRSLI